MTLAEAYQTRLRARVHAVVMLRDTPSRFFLISATALVDDSVSLSFGPLACFFFRCIGLQFQGGSAIASHPIYPHQANPARSAMACATASILGNEHAQLSAPHRHLSRSGLAATVMLEAITGFKRHNVPVDRAASET